MHDKIHEAAISKMLDAPGLDAIAPTRGEAMHDALVKVTGYDLRAERHGLQANRLDELRSIIVPNDDARAVGSAPADGGAREA